MVNYKDLGLVNTREMFKKAIAGQYAIAAFNFNNMEQMQAIIQAAVETKSPVILQVSSGARKYANQTLLRYMAQGAVEYAKELGCAHPQIVLHLDHGDSFELCKSCIDMGFRYYGVYETGVCFALLTVNSISGWMDRTESRLYQLMHRPAVGKEGAE